MKMMDWANDLEKSSKKFLPKLGRRRNAQGNINQEELKTEDENLDGLSSPNSGTWSSSDFPTAPPRSRKTGWGDDLKSSRRKSSAISIEPDRYQLKESIDRREEIPIIPDLDEIIEENSLSELTQAMTIRRNRMETFRELDNDFKKKETFAMLDDVDLSLLTEKLYPEKWINEPDEVWNWDTLFTQITTEINNEERDNHRE